MNIVVYGKFMNKLDKFVDDTIDKLNVCQVW